MPKGVGWTARSLAIQTVCSTDCCRQRLRSAARERRERVCANTARTDREVATDRARLDGAWFVGEHALTSIDLKTLTMTQTYSLATAPRPVASELVLTVRGPQLMVQSHELTIRLPRLWQKALSDLVLAPKGDDDAGTALASSGDGGALFHPERLSGRSKAPSVTCTQVLQRARAAGLSDGDAQRLGAAPRHCHRSQSGGGSAAGPDVPDARPRWNAVRAEAPSGAAYWRGRARVGSVGSAAPRPAFVIPSRKSSRPTDALCTVCFETGSLRQLPSWLAVAAIVFCLGWHTAHAGADAGDAAARLDDRPAASAEEEQTARALFDGAMQRISGASQTTAVAELVALADRFPKTTLAPEALFAAAQQKDESLGAPDQALVLYQRVVVEYPDSRLIRRAQARVAELSASLGRGRGADQFQHIVRSTTSESPERSARLDQLLREQPTFLLAPEALYLLLDGAIRRGDAQAPQRLKQLADRFPASEWTARGKKRMATSFCKGQLGQARAMFLSLSDHPAPLWQRPPPKGFPRSRKPKPAASWLRSAV